MLAIKVLSGSLALNINHDQRVCFYIAYIIKFGFGKVLGFGKRKMLVKDNRD